MLEIERLKKLNKLINEVEQARVSLTLYKVVPKTFAIPSLVFFLLFSVVLFSSAFYTQDFINTVKNTADLTIYTNGIKTIFTENMFVMTSVAATFLSHVFKKQKLNELFFDYTDIIKGVAFYLFLCIGIACMISFYFSILSLLVFKLYGSLDFMFFIYQVVLLFCFLFYFSHFLLKINHTKRFLQSLVNEVRLSYIKITKGTRVVDDRELELKKEFDMKKNEMDKQIKLILKDIHTFDDYKYLCFLLDDYRLLNIKKMDDTIQDAILEKTGFDSISDMERNQIEIRIRNKNLLINNE